MCLTINIYQITRKIVRWLGRVCGWGVFIGEKWNYIYIHCLRFYFPMKYKQTNKQKTDRKKKHNKTKLLKTAFTLLLTFSLKSLP